MSALTESEVKIPKYLQLADYLRQQIDSGQLAPQDRLPSFNEMKALFDATQHTVEKAHLLLEGDGLIRRERRRGVFVNDPTIRETTDFVALLDFKPARQVPFFMEVQQGIREQAQVCGKSITMVDDPQLFKHWKTMDGVLLGDHGRFSFHNSVPGVPQNLPAVRLFYPAAHMSSVMADDASGIALAMAHLLDLGHTRIGYWGDLEQNESEVGSSLEKRYQTYCKALQATGSTPDPAWTHRKTHPSDLNYRDFAYRSMQTWLQNGWRDLKLTAMLAQNDNAAIGMIRALEEHHIRVPEDLSIVGFDGADPSTYAAPELTTIVVPVHEIGATAMRVLVEHINQPDRPPEIIKLPVHLHIGESTAPPKTST